MSSVTQVILLTDCNQTQWCTGPITILDDQSVEDIEFFQLFLRSNDRNHLIAEPNVAIVEVLDDRECK